MSKNIIRVQKNSNYSVLSNEPFTDAALSWKAKGLLAFLLTRPDNWQVNVEHLRKCSTDGRDSVYSALKELMTSRYIVREMRRDEKGRAGGFVYTISETKFPESPFTESPFPEKPLTEKPDSNKDLFSGITDSSKNGGEAEQVPAPTPEEKMKQQKILFCKKIISYVKLNPNKYPKLLYVEFCKYWMEANEGPRAKMRFQKQDVFQISRRLELWFRKTKDDELKKYWEAEPGTPALNVQLSKLL